jgi:site-specific recombinase XerD
VRPLALAAPVVAALERRRQAQMREAMERGGRWDPAGLVFTTPDGQPVDPARDRRAWKALGARAGVPAARQHIARHTAASLLIAGGTDISVVQELLGHADIRTARGYIDVAAEQKRAAAERIADMVLNGDLAQLLQRSPATDQGRE